MMCGIGDVGRPEVVTCAPVIRVKPAVHNIRLALRMQSRWSVVGRRQARA